MDRTAGTADAEALLILPWKGVAARRATLADQDRLLQALVAGP